MVRIILYDAFNSHNKFFDMKAPANNPEKVALLIELAISKGLSKPKPKDDSWWDID